MNLVFVVLKRDRLRTEEQSDLRKCAGDRPADGELGAAGGRRQGASRRGQMVLGVHPDGYLRQREALPLQGGPHCFY